LGKAGGEAKNEVRQKWWARNIGDIGWGHCRCAARRAPKGRDFDGHRPAPAVEMRTPILANVNADRCPHARL
jgi:hypothetical protein